MPRGARCARSRSSPSGSRRARASAPAASAAGPSAACSSRARAICATRRASSLAEAFAALGYGALPTTGWLEPAPVAFVEAHIEQGPLLAAKGAQLGLVTSIAGMLGMEITFSGRRGHAGTVPMELRSDALAAAARFVLAAHESARAIPGAVATIGRLAVAPGATNTIPDRATLFADLRAPDDDRLEQLLDDGRAGSAGCGERRAAAPVALGARWPYPAQRR